MTHKKNKTNKTNETSKREQFFFHDAINQTHGILLFLNQHQMKNTPIGANEIESVKNEIEILQGLIKDHYYKQQLEHKDLGKNSEWIGFEKAVKIVKDLCGTYFDKDFVCEFIVLKKEIEKEASQSFIYLPDFVRIANNLIKNMQEAKAFDISFIFTESKEGFLLETKNKWVKNQLLENENTKRKGVGLKSIDYLVLKNGGSFHFESNNDYWINRVFIPDLSLNIEKFKTAS